MQGEKAIRLLYRSLVCTATAIKTPPRLESTVKKKQGMWVKAKELSVTEIYRTAFCLVAGINDVTVYRTVGHRSR